MSSDGSPADTSFVLESEEFWLSRQRHSLTLSVRPSKRALLAIAADILIPSGLDSFPLWDLEAGNVERRYA